MSKDWTDHEHMERTNEKRCILPVGIAPTDTRTNATRSRGTKAENSFTAYIYYRKREKSYNKETQVRSAFVRQR